MKIKYGLPKGKRFNCSSRKNENRKSKWHRIPIFHGLQIINNEKGLWWCPEFHRWMTLEELRGKGVCYQTWVPLRSVRAAKSHIRRHDELSKGTRFILSSNYVGCDVYFRK